ncbi:MAG: D-alanine--D-alanine ligase [Alphaproteobacteria bacterium]|nr:D-alanine--D-alanine ligase [Alphaproteobacteria bacterium]
MSKKVLVVKGGFSAERDVSLVSGQGIADALRTEGYEIKEYDLQNVSDFLDVLRSFQPDVVFNALHGNWGEDGEIQGLLDMLQIPYTHSGLKASAVGMDKQLTKLVCRSLGIKTPNGEKTIYRDFKSVGTKVAMPYVIKPVCDGSSVGVYIIRTADDLKTIKFDDKAEILIEEYIDGKELTVSVLQGKALTITEMRPRQGFYDYHAKYTDGATDHIIPAEVPESAFNDALRSAEKLHRALDCKTVSRCDFRYNEKDGMVLLEINTAPGMTPLSLVPEQYKYCGGSYSKLCKILVEEASCRKM